MSAPEQPAAVESPLAWRRWTVAGGVMAVAVFLGLLLWPLVSLRSQSTTPRPVPVIPPPVTLGQEGPTPVPPPAPAAGGTPAPAVPAVPTAAPQAPPMIPGTTVLGAPEGSQTPGPAAGEVQVNPQIGRAHV